MKSTRIFVFSLLLVLPTLAQPQQNNAPANCTAGQGQAYIDQGRYDQAIKEFTCLINLQPTGVEGYRGRIEAELLLGQFASGVRDYARVTAYVLPVHPDAQKIILAGYDARLSVDPGSRSALTGASFANWWYFDYAQAIHLLNRLLAVAPDDLYGNLLRGSARLLSGSAKSQGVADLDFAIALAPGSADVRFIVSDAYTYGLPDPARAFAEASLALSLGLDTPRIHAILAVSYQAFGDQLNAAAQIKIHIGQVTTQLLPVSPLPVGGSLSLGLVPGRTYDIPLDLTAGQPLSVRTTSRDFYDSLLVVLAPDGTPLIASDDYIKYFAGLDWIPAATGTYHMLVTSFESVNTGTLVVTRK